MTVSLLLAFLAGCAVMAAAFLVAAWKAPGSAKWLGLVVIVLSAPFFYWLGAFSVQFESGLCYSNAIDSIANAVEKTSAPHALSQQIRELPMRGYETTCSEVESAAATLPNAGTP